MSNVPDPARPRWLNRTVLVADSLGTSATQARSAASVSPENNP